MAVEQSSVSEQLAGWLARLEADELPEGVRERSAATIVDTVGLSVAALETDYGRAVRAAFADPGPATVFGLADGHAPEAAAAINGTCGHGEDFDNTFEGCPVHSGVVIVPALVAAGERYGLSNGDVARGIAAGIEVMCRLGLVARKSVHAAGFHPTAILGTMAAAAGVAAALRLPPKATWDALGVAGSMAAGIIEYLADGSSTKRLHAGWAAQSGLRAAALGAAGFSGPRTVFEGTHGLFNGFANSEGGDFGPLLDGLGVRWETERLAFKPYACGTMTQPYVDCAIALADRGVGAGDIEAIVCEVGEGTVHRLWAPLALKQAPPTAYAAKFSGPYCVASGVVFRDAGLAQFTDEALANSDVRALAAKISYVVDPDNPYPANYTGHVRATLKSGETVETRAPCLRGGAQEPLSGDEIAAKCAANLAFAGRDGSAAGELRRYADALMTGTGAFSGEPLRRIGL